MPKARILAVDDQRYFRELIEALLTEEGYAVRTASSGEEALHILEREDFEIIVTDLVMPGIDGGQLVTRIKEQAPEQDIVMVTGVVDVKTAVDAMKQGATDYILKPFDRKALASSLDTIMQRRRLRYEHARLMAENLEYMGVLSLYDRAMGLFSTLSMEPLGERLVEGLCLETRAQGGVLWVSETPGGAQLVLTAARGLVRLDEEPTTVHVELLGDAFQTLLDEGRSVILPWTPGDAEGNPAHESVALYVPLHAKGSLLGIVRLTDKLEGSAFSEADRASAERFAGFGSVAIANALRFRMLERRSLRDPTTKAYTHAYFSDMARNEIQKANRSGRHFSVIRVELGELDALRSRLSTTEFASWQEGAADEIGRSLRATDLLCSEADHRFAVLLPDTYALGAAVLVQRIREGLEDSHLLAGVDERERPVVHVATASYPTDGTQLEILEEALERRIGDHRSSPLLRMGLLGQSFGVILETLIHGAEPDLPEAPEQVVRFLIEEVARRPRDRGLLFLHPGDRLMTAARQGLEKLRGALPHTEVVMLHETRDARLNDAPVTWVSPRRVGAARPFAVYYGDGPAYAMVTEDKPAGDEAGFFHTSDRALIEHIAFQLRRELGIPLSN